MPETIEDFAKRIKTKYSDYKDVDDYELVDRIVRKHPVYASQVDLPQDFRLLKTSTGYQKLDDIYEKAGREIGVDPNLLLEQGRIETINFKPEVMYGRQNSPKGARGAGQFMPGTAPTYGLTVNATQDDRTDPIKSIYAQAKYMKKLLTQFNGDERLALAGYNAGEGRESLKRGEVPQIRETQDYVKKIGDALTKARNAPTKALRDYYANQAEQIQQTQQDDVSQMMQEGSGNTDNSEILQQKRDDLYNAKTDEEKQRITDEIQRIDTTQPVGGNDNPQAAELEKKRADLHKQINDAIASRNYEAVNQIRPELDKTESELQKILPQGDIVITPLEKQTVGNQTPQKLSFKDNDGSGWQQSDDQSNVDKGFVRLINPQTKRTRIATIGADNQIADVWDETTTDSEYDSYVAEQQGLGKTPLSKDDYLEQQYQSYVKSEKQNKRAPKSKEEFLQLIAKPGLTKVEGYRTYSPNQTVSQGQTNQPQTNAKQNSVQTGVGGVTEDAALISNNGRYGSTVVKNDQDFLNTVAGTVDIDTTKKPSGMSMDEFVFRSAIQAIGGRYGITAQQVNDRVAALKSKGFWRNGQSLNDRTKWRNPDSSTVTAMIDFGTINSVLGGSGDNLTAPISEARKEDELQRYVQRKPSQQLDIPLSEISSAQLDEQSTPRGQAKAQLTDGSLLYNLGLIGDPTEEEIAEREKLIRAGTLPQGQIEAAKKDAEILGKIPIIGNLVAGFMGGAGRTNHSLSGASYTAFGALEDYFQNTPLSSLFGAAKNSYYTTLKQIGDKSIVLSQETNKDDKSFGTQLTKTLGGAIADVPRLIVLSRLPGGAVVGFGTDAALQGIGSGDTNVNIAKNTLKSATLGFVFKGANSLGAATGSQVLAPIVRIGSVGGGTYAVERVFGTPHEEALQSAVINSIFEVVQTYGETALNKTYRLWEKGEPTDVKVEADGTVKLLRGEVKNPAEIEMVLDPTDNVYKQKTAEIVGNVRKQNQAQKSESVQKPTEQLQTSQTPRELAEKNPLRAESANPQAVEKVSVDTRAQKISEALKDGSAKSVADLQKLTKYNPKNISETIDNLYQARVIEILPDNTVRLISEVPQKQEINLYEKYSNQPIRLNESSEIQNSEAQNGNLTTERARNDIQPNGNQTSLETNAGTFEQKGISNENRSTTVAELYENLPQQKPQETKTEKPVAKVDFAERENIGEKLNVFTERGTKAQIQPKVVEASDLLTSLDEGYPQKFQPRDRNRAASKAQIADIAGKLNPEFLGDSPKASDGRPLVVPVQMPDGATKYAIISGNGRTAAIRQAYDLENEGSKKYAEFARSKGETGAKQPVYVGILNPNEIDNFAEFAKESNESATAQMSAAEQARSDADRLDASVLNLFTPSDDGTIHGAANRDFVREFLDRTTSVAERGRFIDSNGKLSQEGVTKVRNAVFAKAFGESEMGMATLARMAESTDSNIKNITNALLAKAGELASFAEATKDNRRHKELNIAPDFARAMEKYSELKESDISIDEYIAQGNLFGADTSPLQTRIMQVFDFYKRRSKSIRHIIDNYLAASEAVGDPNQVNLFGESKAPDIESLFEGAVRSYEQSITVADQAELFAENQGLQSESAPRSESGSTAEKFGKQTEKSSEVGRDRLDQVHLTEIDNISAIYTGEKASDNLNKNIRRKYEQNQSDRDLLLYAKARMNDDMALLNPSGIEFIRRVIESRFKIHNLFAGAFLTPKGTAEIIEAVKYFVNHVGDTRAEKTAKTILNVLESAADNPAKDLIIVAFDHNLPNGWDIAIQEEKGHRAISRAQIADVFTVDLSVEPSIEKSLNAIEPKYSDFDFEDKLDEVFAKSIRDDAETELNITNDERLENLNILLDAVISKGYDIDILANEFENVSQRGKEFAEHTRKRKSDSRSKERDGEIDASGKGEVRRSTLRAQRLREGSNGESTKNVGVVRPNRFTRLQPREIFEEVRGGKLIKQDRASIRAKRDSSPYLTPEKLAQNRAQKETDEAIKKEIRFARPDKTETKIAILGKTLVDIANIPRSIKSSTDLSAPLRQGAVLTVTEPRLAAKAFVEQLKSLKLKNFESFKRKLDIHPYIELAEESGLYLSTLAGENLSDREEAFMSKLVSDDKVFDTALVEKVRRALTLHIRASERAYVTYLDSMRIETFAKLAKEVHEYNVRKGKADDAEQYQGLAKFINYATGRGDLGMFNDAVPVLNTIFFSPRYMASRFQMLNPIMYGKLPPGVRNIAIRKMVGFTAATGLVLLLFGLLGASVDWDDVESPDWLKIKFGDYRYDIGAGFIQPMRLIGRLISAATGDKRGQKELGLITKFLRSKLAPVPGSIVNLYLGKNYVGEDATLSGELKESIVPLVAKDLYEAAKKDGTEGVLKITPAILGVGTGNYPDKPSEKKESAQLAEQILKKSETGADISGDLLNEKLTESDKKRVTLKVFGKATDAEVNIATGSADKAIETFNKASKEEKELLAVPLFLKAQRSESKESKEKYDKVLAPYVDRMNELGKKYGDEMNRRFKK